MWQLGNESEHGKKQNGKDFKRNILLAYYKINPI
jgi:hypothetical protein